MVSSRTLSGSCSARLTVETDSLANLATSWIVARGIGSLPQNVSCLAASMTQYDMKCYQLAHSGLQ